MAAVELYRKLPGFCDTPQMADMEEETDGFYLNRFRVDQNCWDSGYDIITYEDTMHEFKEIAEPDFSALFIDTTTTKPDSEKRLGVYTYVELGDEIYFSELTDVTYTKDNLMNYSLYVWQPVEVKTQCVKAFKFQIDSMTACKEFIK